MRFVTALLSAALIAGAGLASAQTSTPLMMQTNPPTGCGAEKGDEAKGWHSLQDALKSDGYTLHFDQADPRKVKVMFSKDGTTEGKGLLKYRWSKQVNGQAIYVCADSKWNLVDVNAKAQEKPPLLGDWTAVPTDPDASAVVATFRSNYEFVH